jgi:hypothetical protein
MRELVSDDEAYSWIVGWRERWNAETDGSWAITTATTLSALLHTDGWHDMHVHALVAG